MCVWMRACGGRNRARLHGAPRRCIKLQRLRHLSSSSSARWLSHGTAGRAARLLLLHLLLLHLGQALGAALGRRGP